MCVVFDYNKSPYISPSLPYPYPYHQTYTAGRTDLNSVVDDVVAVSSTTATPAPLIPWDIFNLIPTPAVTTRRSEPAFVSPDQKVIEPVLKNQYLTKLQRNLLPPPSHLVADFENAIKID